MSIMRIMLCLLLAAGCAEERLGPNADVRSELSRTHEALGSLAVLFAATVVEGGGAKGGNGSTAQAVLDVSKEFPGQHIAPGRVKLGKQNAAFRISAYSQFETDRDFEVPLNGTRIIAFGYTGTFPHLGSGPLTVYANHVFADTEANHANATLGRGPPASQPFELPLYLASLASAFAAVFLAWFRVKFGVIVLAVSLVFWFAFEAITPSFKIRFELVLLVPLLLVALASLCFGAIREEPTRGEGKPKPGPR